MGRPTDLTPEVHAKIVDLVKGANFPEIAAQACGVGASTHRSWMTRGKKGEEPFAAYRAAIKAAECTAEARAVAVIVDAMLTDWKASAWYLERKNYKRWGRKLSPDDAKAIGQVAKQSVQSIMAAERARKGRKPG